MSARSSTPRTHRFRLSRSLFCTVLFAVVHGGVAFAQTFGLDDLPLAPIVGPPGPVGGLGAEDPFAFVGPPLAPSPSLAILGATGDGAWISPGPVVQHPGPNGFYVDAFSANHTDNGLGILLDFSVDRVTRAVPGTPAAAESLAGQAHGDIYTGTARFASPAGFAGTLPPAPPFVGALPTIIAGAPGNVLKYDESAFGLLTPLGVVPPGVAVPPPFVSPALHDNVDSYDNLASFDANGDFLFDVDTYFTLYPDEAVAVGATAADIFTVAAGDPGAIAVPYAVAPMMGLLPGVDSIDALVMFDNNMKPIPQGQPGAPGLVEPVIDYALFSLAPGSQSLVMWGLSASDVFFTDFTGVFALYANSPDIGLLTVPGGFPFQGDNVDALDATHPCGAPVASSVFFYNGVGINLDVFSASTVVVGMPWTTTMTPQPVRGAGSWFILLRTAMAAGPILDLGPVFGLPPAGLSELLVGGGVITNFGPIAHAGFGLPATFSRMVPLNCALVGSPWYAQAIVLGNLPAGAGLFDPWFSTAAGGTIGTF